MGSYLEYSSELFVEKLDKFSAAVVLLGERQDQAPHRRQQLEGANLIHVLLGKGRPSLLADPLIWSHCESVLLADLKEGNDLGYDGFYLTVQLLDIDLGAAGLSRRSCSHTHTQTHSKQTSSFRRGRGLRPPRGQTATFCFVGRVRGRTRGVRSVTHVCRAGAARVKVGFKPHALIFPDPGQSFV